MDFKEKQELSKRLQHAEKAAYADYREFSAKKKFFAELSEKCREQSDLLANARYQLWEKED